ncbi:hypothetical protein H0H93_010886, partial [Arthromyces matolae]
HSNYKRFQFQLHIYIRYATSFTPCPNASLFGTQVDSVVLYGSVGPDHGLYSVQLDDQSPKMYQAAQMTPGAQIPLYYITQLEYGNHIIHVVNEENAVFAIDWANLKTVSNSTVTSDPSATAGLAPTNASNQVPIPTTTKATLAERISPGAIGGIAVGAFIGLMLLILGLLVCVRASKKKAQMRGGSTILSQFDMGEAVVEDPTLDSPSRSEYFLNTPISPTGSPIESTKSRFWKSHSSPVDYAIAPLYHSAPENTVSTLPAEDGSNAQDGDKRTRK